jgi:hypothetical protein
VRACFELEEEDIVFCEWSILNLEEEEDNDIFSGYHTFWFEPGLGLGQLLGQLLDLAWVNSWVNKKY